AHEGSSSGCRRVSRSSFLLFFFQAEDGIRDRNVTGVQTCALPISHLLSSRLSGSGPTARCAWNSTFSRITPQAPVTQFIRPATRRLRFPFTPTGRERTAERPRTDLPSDAEGTVRGRDRPHLGADRRRFSGIRKLPVRLEDRRVERGAVVEADQRT